MKLRTTALVLLLCLIPAQATGWQEPKPMPKANISGPSAKLPGRSAIFHAQGSAGKHLSWYIHPLPIDSTFLPLNTSGQAGDALLFETEQQGKYEVLLVASDKPVELRPVGSVTLLRADGAVDVASMTLEIRGDEPPKPPTPPTPPPDLPKPPPGPLTNFAKISYDGAMKVDVEHRGQAKVLAEAQRQAANMAVALSDPGAILKGWRELNNAAVNKFFWNAWALDVARVLEDGYKAGTIRTGSEFSRAFSEFAVGLEAVK